MRPSIVSSALAALFLFTAVVSVASAESVITCGTRMPSMERAKCMVIQRQQILEQLGRGGNASSYSRPAQTLPPERIPTVVIEGTSSSIGQLSCSRQSDRIQKARCLVEQRKKLLEQLAKLKAALPIPAAVVTAPRRPNCNRYTSREDRLSCLNGKPVSGSSSSVSSGQ
ncbi:MAG: hypothetical protein Greene101449_76 [Candidatus Peregrinibacteria bacterium Greene1014_49]|nr:MAG: hypothetical protein Greene101449_76 [Candidatus Peregrinibacteria bacterium Greene1014_49]